MNKSDTVDVKWKRVDGPKKFVYYTIFSINLPMYWFIFDLMDDAWTIIRQRKLLLHIMTFMERNPTRSKFYKDLSGSYMYMYL